MCGRLPTSTVSRRSSPRSSWRAPCPPPCPSSELVPPLAQPHVCLPACLPAWVGLHNVCPHPHHTPACSEDQGMLPGGDLPSYTRELKFGSEHDPIRLGGLDGLVAAHGNTCKGRAGGACRGRSAAAPQTAGITLLGAPTSAAFTLVQGDHGVYRPRIVVQASTMPAAPRPPPLMAFLPCTITRRLRACIACSPWVTRPALLHLPTSAAVAALPPPLAAAAETCS